MKLASLGWIHGIHIEQHQTGTDTADTFCKITGSNGTASGLWSEYAQFLNVRPGHCYIAELKDDVRKQVEEWNEYERKNKAELATYKRLKAKFEGIDS
jgi:hypothetical protein